MFYTIGKRLLLQPAPQQKGAILIISLLILLVLTVVGAAAMNTTVMEEKMAANNQYKTTTFQIAESAIQRYWSVAGVAQALNYPSQNYVTSIALGRVFDPIKIDPNTDPIISDAQTAIDYCGEYTGKGTGINADFSEGIVNIKQHAFDVRGRGEINAINAISVNERRAGLAGPSRNLKKCNSTFNNL